MSLRPDRFPTFEEWAAHVHETNRRNRLGMSAEDEAQWRSLWFEAVARDVHPVDLVRQRTQELIAENE